MQLEFLVSSLHPSWLPPGVLRSPDLWQSRQAGKEGPGPMSLSLYWDPGSAVSGTGVLLPGAVEPSGAHPLLIKDWAAWEGRKQTRRPAVFSQPQLPHLAKVVRPSFGWHRPSGHCVPEPGLLATQGSGRALSWRWLLLLIPFHCFPPPAGGSLLCLYYMVAPLHFLLLGGGRGRRGRWAVALGGEGTHGGFQWETPLKMFWQTPEGLIPVPVWFPWR